MRDPRSLRDQLAPISARLQTSRPRIQPVCQINAYLSGADAKVSFDRAQRQILRWMEVRAGARLPEAAWLGHDFELEHVGAQPAAAVELQQHNYWTARLDDADREVPRRRWVTEAGLYLKDGMVRVGVRLTCVTQGEGRPYVPSIPRLVRDLSVEPGLEFDGRHLQALPWLVASGDDVEELVDFLRSPYRKRPVYVVSLPEDETDPDKGIIPGNRLSSLCIGAAHAVVITCEASWALTRALEKEFSVFHGAVRTYQPAFDPDHDQPFDHPLALRHKIEAWPDGGPSAFLEWLIARAIRATTLGIDLEHALPSFWRIRRIRTEEQQAQQRDQPLTDAEQLSFLHQRLNEIQKEEEETKSFYDGLLQLAESERDEARAQAEELRSEAFGLRARIQYLDRQLTQRSVYGAPEEPEIPRTLEDLESWAHRHLAGAVVIHNRALRAAKKSQFADTDLVYRALLLLRDKYVPMRKVGGKEKVEEFRIACAQLALSEEPCFAGASAQKYEEEYFISFAGRRSCLDRHVKGSNARDERYCLRIYFFWDEETQQVVIGWLPSHLRTGLS
jgi:hypothetical protein